MPVTYTSRKGLTYTLCQGTTKTGKPRYYFAREPKDQVLDQIPDGYAISESVNGIVSLIKDRPSQLQASEIAAVEAQLHKHPKNRNYRLGVKSDRMEIYELVGPDPQTLLAALATGKCAADPIWLNGCKPNAIATGNSLPCCASSWQIRSAALFARSECAGWAASMIGSMSNRTARSRKLCGL